LLVTLSRLGRRTQHDVVGCPARSRSAVRSSLHEPRQRSTHAGNPTVDQRPRRVPAAVGAEPSTPSLVSTGSVSPWWVSSGSVSSGSVSSGSVSSGSGHPRPCHPGPCPAGSRNPGPCPAGSGHPGSWDLGICHPGLCHPCQRDRCHPGSSTLTVKRSPLTHHSLHVACPRVGRPPSLLAAARWAELPRHL
jgi:hypothetical protein